MSLIIIRSFILIKVNDYKNHFLSTIKKGEGQPTNLSQLIDLINPFICKISLLVYPFCLPCNSHDDNLENLVLDQQIIP